MEFCIVRSVGIYLHSLSANAHRISHRHNVADSQLSSELLPKLHLKNARSKDLLFEGNFKFLLEFS